MRMNAAQVVEAIGEGVAAALATNRLFLGVETDAYQNADIHPEYVTTVEVAKKLTAPDRQVSLETHMKELRMQARALWMLANTKNKANLHVIDPILAKYRFGKRDSQRLDILVQLSDVPNLPILLAEAKLGAKNLAGIIQDIDRIVRLMDMYNELNLLDSNSLYGAVVFHSMEEGRLPSAATQTTQTLLSGIQAYLKSVKGQKSWLRSKAGLLTVGAQIQPIIGYAEQDDDGTEYQIFAKESFSFAPGMILLGNADDVETVNF